MLTITNIKEKLLGSLGLFGVALYVILTFIALFAPLATFHIHWIVSLLIILVAVATPTIFSIASPFLYILALYRIFTGQCHVNFLFWIGFAVWVLIAIVPFALNLIAFVIDFIMSHVRKK